MMLELRWAHNQVSQNLNVRPVNNSMMQVHLAYEEVGPIKAI